MLLGDIIKNNSRMYPDRAGLIGEDGSIKTWSEINHRGNRLCNALAHLGLNKWDRIAVLSEDIRQYGFWVPQDHGGASSQAKLPSQP